jgi:hypothetical protein
VSPTGGTAHHHNEDAVRVPREAIEAWPERSIVIVPENAPTPDQSEDAGRLSFGLPAPQVGGHPPEAVVVTDPTILGACGTSRALHPTDQEQE